MAIFHVNANIIQKSKGQSAVAHSAYIAGEKMVNEQTGEVFDYTRKSGVVFSEIFLCANAPKEYEDRATLWNAVEANEKNKNAQLARNFNIALPKELSTEENIELVKEYVKENFTQQGMIADVAIHEPDKATPNPHAHITLTMRGIEEDGTWKKFKEKKVFKLDEDGNRIPIIDKTTGEQKVDSRNRKQWKREKVEVDEWSKTDALVCWRKNWAHCVNQKLAEKGIDERIDHRSYEKQGIDKIPTIHEGSARSYYERTGIITEKLIINAEIKANNKEIEIINTQIKEIQFSVKELETKIEQEPAPAEQKQGYEEMAAIYEKSKNAHVLEPANTHKTDILEKTAEQSAEKIERAIASFSEEERKQFEVTEENCRRFDRELIEESFASTPKLADLNQGEKRAEVQKPAKELSYEETQEKIEHLQNYKNYVRTKEMTAFNWVESSKKVYDYAKNELRKAEKALEHRKEELQHTTGLFSGGKRKELQEKIKRLEEKVIPAKKEALAEAKETYENKVSQHQEYQKQLASIEKSIASYEKMMAQMQAPAQQEPAQEKEKEPVPAPKQEGWGSLDVHKSRMEEIKEETGMNKGAAKSPAEKEIIRIPKEYFEEPEKQKSKTQSWSQER